MFVGWYTTLTGGTRVASNTNLSAVTAGNQITLTARWTQDVYGIFNIKSVSKNRYMTGDSVNPYLFVGDLNGGAYERWVIQKIGAHYQVRSGLVSPSGIGKLNRDSTGNAIVNTPDTNISVTRNADGTVTFRLPDTGYMLRATSFDPRDTGVRWMTNTGAPDSSYKWILEPHPLNYRKGDVNQDGKIDMLDANEILKYINNMNSNVNTAAGFYLADITHDGTVDILDVNEIIKYLSGVSSLIG